MGRCEGGHGRHDALPGRDQQEHREDIQEMIHAREDVLDAETRVRIGHMHPCRRRLHDE